MSSPWPRARIVRAAAAARPAVALEHPAARARGRRPSAERSIAAGRRAPRRAPRRPSPRPRGRHGSRPARKHASDFHRLPIPHTLRWSSRASPMPRLGSSSRRRRRNASSSNSSARMSGPSARDPVVEARARVGHQLQHRAAELHDLVLGGADHEPGAAAAPAPALPAPVDAPPAVHAEVRVEGQVALEADEQVLALRVHRAHGAPAQPLGPAVAREPRVRRLDRLDLPVDSAPRMRLGRAVDRVALGHAAEGSCPQLTRCRVSVPLPT